MFLVRPSIAQAFLHFSVFAFHLRFRTQVECRWNADGTPIGTMARRLERRWNADWNDGTPNGMPMERRWNADWNDGTPNGTPMEHRWERRLTQADGTPLLAMSCHGIPWHAMACHGMLWHGRWNADWNLSEAMEVPV